MIMTIVDFKVKHRESLVFRNHFVKVSFKWITRNTIDSAHMPMAMLNNNGSSLYYLKLLKNKISERKKNILVYLGYFISHLYQIYHQTEHHLC